MTTYEDQLAIAIQESLESAPKHFEVVPEQDDLALVLQRSYDDAAEEELLRTFLEEDRRARAQLMPRPMPAYSQRPMPAPTPVNPMLEAAERRLQEWQRRWGRR
jgi:hypothetical protein